MVPARSFDIFIPAIFRGPTQQAACHDENCKIGEIEAVDDIAGDAKGQGSKDASIEGEDASANKCHGSDP